MNHRLDFVGHFKRWQTKKDKKFSSIKNFKLEMVLFSNYDFIHSQVENSIMKNCEIKAF